jgi:hypothetical protein
MKLHARVVQLQQSPGEALGLGPKYSAQVVFRGDAAGSVVLNVSSEVYDRLKVHMDRGEQPDLEVHIVFD